MHLPFDPEDPPAAAPGNAHPTVWRLAYTIHRDHQPHTDGWCAACKTPREFWPCPASKIAARGFLFALAMRDPD